MKLAKTQTVEIVPVTPFGFDATFHKPDHFPSGDNFWEPGIRWQTFHFLKKDIGVVFKNTASSEICVEIYSDEQLSDYFVDEFIKEIRYRYNLDLDLNDFYHRFLNDPFVGPAIQRMHGMRPGHQGSLYEYLIIGILLQNCTVRRSIAMMQALFEKYGTLLEFDGKKLWCFWEPGSLTNVSEDELRALKIGYRAKSIKRTDDYLLDEIELRKKDRETQMKELLKLYGVGPATVWYLLFDVFHRYDFFNHISPWEQKIYSKLFFDTDPEKPVSVSKLMKHFEKYRKYKQLAVHYLWEDLWWTRLQSPSAIADGGQERKHEHIPWLEKLIKA